jgi:transposase
MPKIKHIGIDLHTNCFTIAYRDNTGNFIFDEFNLFKNENIERFKKLLDKDVILAVEATINSNFFYQSFKSFVKKILIVNTNKFDNKKSKKKTDKEDAKRILIFLEAGMLSEIWVAPKEVVRLRKLINIQKQLESIQTGCKNMLGNLLIENGIKRKRNEITHKDNIALFSNDIFDENHKLIARNLVETIKYVEIKNAVMKHAIVKYTGEDKRIELLMSIPGISHYSAASILAEIGDITRFDSAKKLCSYAGLVPILEESNKKRKQKGITKSGRRKLRYFVTFAVLNAIRSSKSLKAFYDRIALKGSKMRAMVATGRKLLTIIYHILTREEPFKEMKDSLYKRKIASWKRELSINEYDINCLMKTFIEKEILENLFLTERLNN